MTDRPRCGPDCKTCAMPIREPEPFPGIEECERRQAAYAERRRITAASNNFPIDRKPIRGDG